MNFFFFFEIMALTEEEASEMANKLASQMEEHEMMDMRSVIASTSNLDAVDDMNRNLLSSFMFLSLFLPFSSSFSSPFSHLLFYFLGLA